MSTEAELPLVRGEGCLAKGCLGIVGLVILLVIALAAGALWGVHYLRQTYSATEQVVLPTSDSTRTTVTPSPDQPPIAAAPDALPTPQSSREVLTRWKSFVRAGARHEKARIELTAADINGLFNGDPELRGKGFVAIENNVGRLRFSVPLNDLFMMQGRYLNGEATIEASPDGDPTKIRISNILLANQPVPENVLDRRIFGWLPIRAVLTKWLDEHDIVSFRVQNNVVIGETRGP